VLDAFPGAQITGARTVRLYVKDGGDSLTALDVNARRGAERIKLQLRGAARTELGPDAGGRGGMLRFGAQRIVQYETTRAQYDVLVQVVAPADEHVELAALAQLARDDRLLNRN
jgi:hypothetical protein